MVLNIKRKLPYILGTLVDVEISCDYRDEGVNESRHCMLSNVQLALQLACSRTVLCTAPPPPATVKNGKLIVLALHSRVVIMGVANVGSILLLSASSSNVNVVPPCHNPTHSCLPRFFSDLILRRGKDISHHYQKGKHARLS